MTLPPPECKVYTPPHLANAMVQAIEPRPEDCWLDPCMGPGAFIAPLRKTGIPKQRIFGIDIESSPGLEDAAATTVRGVDFFAWCSSTTRRFTRIVANPPYVAIRKLDPELQRVLQGFGTSDCPSYTLRSNYWCAFLAACLRILEPEGNLAFVLPAAWDYALYAEDVRRSIFDGFRSVEVHRCFEPLFPNVREGCVVLIAKGYLQKPARTVRIDHATATSLVATLNEGSGTPTKQYAVTTDPVNQSFVRLSDLYSIGIGCVTGDARYFLLTEEGRVHHGLPLEALRPVLSKARHLTAASMTKAQWKRLLAANERVWLFSPNARTLKQKAVRAYLKHGEATCNLDGYKLRHREPWYDVPMVGEGAGFLSGMSKLGPWLSFRSMRHLLATNTLYVVTAKSKLTATERAAWALSLLSGASRKQVRELVRRYPDGLPKLEPHDLSALRLPPPIKIKGACEDYERAVRLLRDGDETAAMAIADTYVRPSC
ncbi:MAG: N-6 DNA methylase [Bryobacteraceae bacterium]